MADLPKQGLTNLFNSGVKNVEYHTRPLDSGLFSSSSSGSGTGGIKFGPLHHAGVVVTTNENQRYLIHKGDGYGKASDTVITDAKHMSNRWTLDKSSNIAGSGNTVNDLMKAGHNDKKYSLGGGHNCQDAAKGIWKESQGKK